MKRTPRIAFARTCAGICAAALLQSSVAWAAPPAGDEPAAAADSDPATTDDPPADRTSDAEPTDAEPTDAEPTDAEPTEGDPTDAVPTDVAPAEPPADAEPDPTRQEAASLFREGSMFYELGQYEDAITKFEAAWKLEPMPQLLFNMGQAQRRWYELEIGRAHV